VGGNHLGGKTRATNNRVFLSRLLPAHSPFSLIWRRSETPLAKWSKTAFSAETKKRILSKPANDSKSAAGSKLFYFEDSACSTQG
ncbi:MAG: hypothetical protein IKD70_03205, partial [Eggerthellaceae bacterium]|nr:hypothetical protein [Eggerthellaceae bacterium]